MKTDTSEQGLKALIMRRLTGTGVHAAAKLPDAANELPSESEVEPEANDEEEAGT